MEVKAPHLRYKRQTPRERTWTIHLIALEKAIKGLLLIAVSFKLLSLFGRDVHDWATDFVTRHGIDLTNRYVHTALERLVGVGNKQLVEMSIVALAYAALLFTEGLGLWLQKRWAEYLTTFATAAFIPFEIYELYERFTWVRIAVIAINIFVVWYLSTRLKDEKHELGHTESTGTSIKVKICGITNVEDGRFAAACGADDLGFNFYDKSSRYVAPEKAKLIAGSIGADVLYVGVFVDETVEKVSEIAMLVGLDVIQLHGGEDNGYIDELHLASGLPVIKAFRVGSELDVNKLTSCTADAVLLDKFSAKEMGGTGEAFDWRIAKNISSKVERVYLSGGLTPDNVAEAVRVVRPYAVDACSRLESSPGRKDRNKVAAFIKAAKEAI
jgi:phosphoribosylanthranilate isomerase